MILSTQVKSKVDAALVEVDTHSVQLQSGS